MLNITQRPEKSDIYKKRSTQLNQPHKKVIAIAITAAILFLGPSKEGGRTMAVCMGGSPLCLVSFTSSCNLMIRLHEEDNPPLSDIVLGESVNCFSEVPDTKCSVN